MNQAAQLQELRERLALISHLGSASALLSWDHSTQMPRGGAASRGRVMGTLARLQHEHTIDPALVGLIESLQQAPLEGDDAALVREAGRAVERAVKIPSDLVAAMTEQSVRARTVWERARAENDYASFAPELRKNLALAREQAAALNPNAPAYDVLHDLYERGSTAAAVDAVFAPLRQEVVALSREIASAKRQPDLSILQRPFPEAQQEAFGREVAAALGYDFNRGRLDRTVHPFAIRIADGDVRITTRYQETFMPTSLFGTIHEAGHAMYEQNLPSEHADNPLGEAVSLGVHESQSRLWENLVGRSPAFWQGAYGKLRAAFPGVLDDVSEAAFVFAINAVQPSLIRVEADEVTYHLHVMLRFDLERALIDGSLDVADLPAAWAEKSQAFLGVTPPDDREGCLQDVHWSMGAFGYFPTYSLGTLISVQLWEAMARDLGDLEALVRAGSFQPIFNWLVDKVHRHGSRLSPQALVESATGAPLSAAPYLRYVRAKYGALYGL